VLTLVGCGYQEQSVLFEHAKFETWRLTHSGSQWLLASTPGTLADDLRRLSREALFQMRQVESWA
jgi:hypothetical protein